MSTTTIAADLEILRDAAKFLHLPEAKHFATILAGVKNEAYFLSDEAPDLLGEMIVHFTRQKTDEGCWFGAGILQVVMKFFDIRKALKEAA